MNHALKTHSLLGLLECTEYGKGIQRHAFILRNQKCFYYLHCIHVPRNNDTKTLEIPATPQASSSTVISDTYAKFTIHEPYPISTPKPSHYRLPIHREQISASRKPHLYQTH